jgi:NADH dehydrogenase [ubiquinone] 1 alpha subcomplex assembly factor 7
MRNNLDRYIKGIILNNGYLELDKFFQIVSHYYYSHNNSIGAGNDFITAPEISQMFGEMLGIHVTDVWQRKIKEPFTIVELGPGNGTMMNDILRTIKSFPSVYQNIQEVALVETSPRLKAVQQEALKTFDAIKISWHTNLEEVSGNKFFIVANEFFDALPIKQYCLKNDKVYEVVISLNDNDNFIYSLIPANNAQLDTYKLKEHQLLELSTQREGYAKIIAKKIANEKGAALIVDYGYLSPPGKSTLQAVKHHKKVGFFESIGDSDITSLVDFSTLKDAFNQFNIETEILTQRDFLLNSGILQRAEMLIKASASHDAISYQIEKLISAKEMGELFKVLITPA